MRTLPTLLFFLAASTPSFAQSFNLDVDNFFGTPSNALGAAAAQPGTWNDVPAALGTTPLVDITGAATGVTISGTGLGAAFSFDNAGTTGDDQALMDDLSDPSPSGATWTFSGLTPGNYILYTYGWAPDNATFRSTIAVAGSSDGPQNVGGAWPGGYTLGITHARHHVTVGGAGTIAMTITVAGGGSFASLNGFQLAPDNTPVFVQNCVPGTGGVTACPCANPPAGGGLGCDNFGAGPADSGTLNGTGNASLANDTLVLNATGENNTALTVFFTGSGALTNGVAHGAGIRCVNVSLKRLYTGNASAGAISRPGMGDPSVSVRTAALGVPISAGDTRHYFNIYRDPNAAGPCGNTASTVNLTNSGSVTWGP